ncbi:hypothetical protein ABZS66_55030 [Dactylosporangium sp. NPDC005572]|uniref:hypothetical protein n=1 Tax=Dactylosporangium sp. NPDC005572 TaxID=3156889 RepID=UPI0033BD6152
MHRQQYALVAAVVAGVVAGSVALVPVPASAHPFGDPQTIAVAFDSQRADIVRVTWRVGGPDDLTLLGVSLGLLPRDRIHADGTVDVQYTDPGVIGAAAAFTGYLLNRVTVTDGSQACTATVEPVRALALKGATAVYTCPGPVATASVAVRMLTDLNPAYKTLATGPAGQRFVYDSGTDTHDWTPTGASAPGGTSLGRSAAVQLAVVIGGLLLAAAFVVAVARKVRRRQVAA